MSPPQDRDANAPTIIVLSSEFVEDLEPGVLDELVAQIVDLARTSTGRPVDEIADDLAGVFQAGGAAAPDVVLNRLGEILSNATAESIAVTLDDDTVLYGDPDLGGAHTAGYLEPENDERSRFT